MTMPATPPPSRAVPRLLAVLAVALLAMLAWRAYSPRFTARPTELVTVATPVDVNAADRGELLQIPGVGPATAIQLRRRGPMSLKRNASSYWKRPTSRNGNGVGGSGFRCWNSASVLRDEKSTRR